MSAKFKPGDKVRLVDNEGVCTEYFPYMNTGQALVVHQCGDVFVYFVGHESARWYTSRFELVQRAKPKKRRDYVADHARRTLRKAGLSVEEARRVVQNWDNDGTVKLSELSRKLPRSLADLLLSAFRWEGSPEGASYWIAVHSREILKEKNNAQAQ